MARGFLSREFLSGGLCPGSFCLGVFCPRTHMYIIDQGLDLKAKAMFILYWIVKRSVAEIVPGKVSVHTMNATFGRISAPEQDYFAPFSRDVITATQRNSCSSSHCTGSVSATLRFTIRYGVNIA